MGKRAGIFGYRGRGITAYNGEPLEVKLQRGSFRSAKDSWLSQLELDRIYEIANDIKGKFENKSTIDDLHSVALGHGLIRRSRYFNRPSEGCFHGGRFECEEYFFSFYIEQGKEGWNLKLHGLRAL